MFRDSSLLYFYVVAQTGSIRQAADKLHISSSAISRMVAKAESDFGAILFDRRADGMRLTAEGQLLSDELGDVFARLDDVKERIAELKGRKQAHVTLACIEGVIEELAPGFLADFHHDFPDVKSTVASAAPDLVISSIQSDTADIGIFFGLPHQAPVQTLFSHDETMHAIMAPSHPLAVRKELSLKELTNQRIAMPDGSFGARRLLDGALHKLGIEMPALMTTNSIDLTLRMAITGEALTVLPRFAIRRRLDQLIAVPLVEHRLLTGALIVCKKIDRPLPAAAVHLLKYIEASFDSLRSHNYVHTIPDGLRRA
jgi:DNA-binding transcriptional LysR family regulator